MKRTVFTLCLVMFGFMAAYAQCSTNVALSGCVGACGSSYLATYTVTAADMGGALVKPFCLAATQNSLCPNQVAVGTLSSSGGGSVTGILSNGAVLTLNGSVGTVFTVYVRLGRGDRNIECIWQGQTEFDLTH